MTTACTGQPSQAAGKVWRWEKLPLEIFRLTPEESAGQKLWRGPRPHRLQEQSG